MRKLNEKIKTMTIRIIIKNSDRSKNDNNNDRMDIIK